MAIAAGGLLVAGREVAEELVGGVGGRVEGLPEDDLFVGTSGEEGDHEAEERSDGSGTPNEPTHSPPLTRIFCERKQVSSGPNLRSQ
jgi:hypothetical protein